MRAPLLLALVLLAPLSVAHIEEPRPYLQRFENPRLVDMAVSGTSLEVLLTQREDILRDSVRHDLVPSRGLIEVEHRPHASTGRDAFTQRVVLERVIEYQDRNNDERYQAETDTILKSWRLRHYDWRPGPIRDVLVGEARAKEITWTGNLSTGPQLVLQVVAPGRTVTDEGAQARAQDLLLYLDVLDFPPRTTGALHALELLVTTPKDATVALDLAAENATLGLHVDHAGRRGFFVWGGEAQVDGAERLVAASLGPPSEGGGNATRELHLSLPRADRQARFVMVSAVEYEDSAERAPLPAYVLLAGALVAAAAWRLRRSG